MTAQCPVHGTLMKLVPAGISKKSGKRYNAFYACEDQECKETAPATNEAPVTPQKPLTGISLEEPMQRKDWDRKEFIKGLAVFSSNERSQGMSPVEAVKSSHTFDWMFVAYGDNPNYAEWAKEAIARIKTLSGKQQAKESEEIHEDFDRDVEELANEDE